MKRKVWALLTTLAICISSTNLSALAAGEGVVLEQQAIDVSTSTEQMEYMIPFCEEKENVTVEFKLVNEWENGYQAEIVLTNIGTEAWNNWQLDFLSVNNITNIWNGNVLQNKDGICSVSASECNGTVEPNGTVSIGYCAEGMDYSIKDLRISISTVDEEQDDTLQPEAGDSFMYEYEHFAVEYIIQNSWSENCNVCLRISNTSEVDIENWQLVWESEDAISNVYNAKMTYEDNIYTLKNVEYNQDILVGDMVEIGFDVYYGDSLDIPKGFAMLDAQQIVVNEGYSVENVVTNTWDSGYTGELWLTNTGSNTMEDWYLTIQSEDVITNIWIGALTNLGNGMYSIKNPQHQQNLQPGETIIIGYQSEGNQPDSLVPVMLSVYVGEKDEVGESGENDDTSDDDGNNNHEDDANDNGDSGTTEDNTDDNDNDDTTEEDTGNDDREVDSDEDDEEEPLNDNYIEISTVFEEKYMDMAYMVEEEIDTYQGVVNNLSKVKCVEYTINDAFGNVVKNGNIDYDTATGAWIIEGFGLVVGWNDVVFSICLNDDIIIKETYSYLNSVYENMENTDVGLSDTDGDGLEDYFESVYGTDKNNADSDGDGLNDLEEMLFGTDPGVQDAEEDADEDGLTVAEELQYGTSPWHSDSDLDDIDDKKEITEVGTDPTKEDTDEDGLTDGVEIKLGTNPLISDSDGDGVLDVDEKIQQQVSMEIEEVGAVSGVTVSLACSGDMEHQVFVKNTMGEDELSSNVVGLIGVPVEINSMTSFEEAQITFQYDKEQLGETKEEDLCILWYDEENMTYVMLEDCVVDTQKQTVSYTTTHFSTYLLIDKEIWLDAWRSEINYDEITSEDIQSTYDIYVCLDYSVTEDELELEKEFARKIVNQMVPGDRFILGVVTSTSQRRFYSYPTASKETALDMINNMEETVQQEQNKIKLEADGTYRAECNEAIHLLTEMAGTAKSKNECVGFIVNAGKNEDAKKMFYYFSDAGAATDLEELGFPVHTVSVTYETNEKLVTLLEAHGGRSFNLNTADQIIGCYGSDSDTLDMLDSDGDGLYDTYEINGMRIQNGTVAYTDPYSVDSDGDGVTDYAEMGGLPSEILKDDYVYIISYQKSNPNNFNSTGKELTAGYMIVEDFDYLPYDKKNYNKIFFDDTGEVDVEGKPIYGLYNLYNSNPNELSRKEIIEILFLVELECILLEAGDKLPDAREFLMKYIENETVRNMYDCSGILEDSSEARDMWAQDIYHLMLAAENYLDIGQTTILTQTPENSNNGVNYVIKKECLWDSANYFLAIHSAIARTVAEVSYDGLQYTMDFKFYIFDYYDWDKEDYIKYGFVSPRQLYKLCRSGNARFYENWGVYETQFVWKPTDEGRQDALNAEMYLMVNGKRRE